MDSLAADCRLCGGELIMESRLVDISWPAARRPVLQLSAAATASAGERSAHRGLGRNVDVRCHSLAPSAPLFADLVADDALDDLHQLIDVHRLDDMIEKTRIPATPLVPVHAVAA